MPRILAVLLWCVASCLPAWAAPPPPMLATDHRAGDTLRTTDWLVSEKLDGVRGRWDGRVLWSRGGLRIDVPDWFTRGWPAEAMEGELWLGRGRFDATSALVRGAAHDDPRWRALEFRVFDLPAMDAPFAERARAIETRLATVGVAWLQPVAQQRFADPAALDAHLRAVVAAGGEGLMLHRADARPVAGRSDALRKYKPHADAEARVVGHAPGQGKYSGQLGALVVELPDGRRLRLGSGLTDAQRADPPPVGSRVTYRYNGLTSTGLPRFARFLRVRDDTPSPAPAEDQARGDFNAR